MRVEANHARAGLGGFDGTVVLQLTHRKDGRKSGWGGWKNDNVARATHVYVSVALMARSSAAILIALGQNSSKYMLTTSAMRPWYPTSRWSALTIITFVTLAAGDA
jgi:hypothetical protein